MELYIEPIKPQRNYKNGRFLKGHESPFKGKKWENLMTPESIERNKKRATETLLKCSRKNSGGHGKKPVVAIESGRFVGSFESLNDASRKLKLPQSNISGCCNGKKYTHVQGINFFFESDFEKWSKLIIE